MNPQTQHWTTRTPLRVKVLGLLFFIPVLGMLGLLTRQWGLAWPYVLGVQALLMVGLWWGYYRHHQTLQHLGCDDQSHFFLLAPHPQPVQLTQLWQSAWAVCLHVQALDCPQRTYRLVLWRQAHSLTAWRYLHIHVLRYQLQHSGFSAAGTV